MTYTSDDRIKMSDACRQAAGSAGINSDLGRELANAARIIDADGETAWFAHELAQFSAACDRALLAQQGNATQTLNRKVQLHRAAIYLNALAEAARLAPGADPLAGTMKTRQERAPDAATHLPLKPLRLTISCAPEGGWIAEGDTQHFEASRPLAAFSSAADLLPWIAERLYQHESSSMAAKPESETDR